MNRTISLMTVMMNLGTTCDLVSGFYHLSVSQSEFTGYLSFSLFPGAAQAWGSFTIGSKIGTIRVDGISGLADGEERSFGWRSEDDETKKLKFGRGCDGRFVFDGQGEVRGCFFGLMDGEAIEFEGDREGIVEDPLEFGEFQDEWDDFPRRAYGRT